jgi:hypothetical protein
MSLAVPCGRGWRPNPGFSRAAQLGGFLRCEARDLLGHAPCASQSGLAGLLDRMTSDAEAIDWWERATPRQRQ